MKATLAIVIAAFAAVSAGCATSSSPSDAARIAADTSKASSLDRACVSHTGTRIRPAKGEEAKVVNCAQPGSTYSKEQLEQTGEIDTARALQKLDPRIQ
jgi:hypothetical protein